MFNLKNKWIIITLFSWLLCCQVLFYVVQNSFGQKVIESTENQLRQELSFSNFHYLARSITDYTQSGAIRCSKLEKVSPDFFQVIDLSYMGSKCHWPAIFLWGASFDVQLKSLNGDVYRFQFVNNNPIFFSLALWGFRILGLMAILGVFFALQAKIKYAQKVQKMAWQVSHDIRSPLAVLSEGIQDNFSNPELMKRAVVRIEGIANDLLQTRKEEIGAQKIESLSELLVSLIGEKKIQYKNKNPKIELITVSPDSDFKITLIDLSRLISNLLNNALEASSNPEVKIEVTASTISISDNGAGIPKDVFEKLGRESITTKSSGNGIGLLSAFQKMKEWGGELLIQSQIGKGTRIILDFNPQSSVQKWTILVDDDALIRLTWESKAKLKSVPFKSFATSEELLTHLSEFEKNSVFYLDLEIKGSSLTGDLLAKKLKEKGYEELYLASGHEVVAPVILASFKGQHSKKCPF